MDIETKLGLKVELAWNYSTEWSGLGISDCLSDIVSKKKKPWCIL